jgi:uncharacterized protein YdhG (YjbR/CyaY superfamily)
LFSFDHIEEALGLLFTVARAPVGCASGAYFLHKMQSKAPTIAAFVGGLPANKREVVETLESIVRTALPEAAGSMKYGMPTFEIGGRMVAFNAQKNYFAFYADPEIVKSFSAELMAFDVGKSCIRFRTLDPDLAATLKHIVGAYRK